MISCFPSKTPPTKGKAARNPYRAPVAIMAIFAGPGVPTWEKANAVKLNTATLIY
jgi:hypothetical protein